MSGSGHGRVMAIGQAYLVGEVTPRATGQLSVFSRPRTSADELPPQLLEEFAAFANRSGPASEDPRAQRHLNRLHRASRMPAESRLLLRDAEAGYRLYCVPVDDGSIQLCLFGTASRSLGGGGWIPSVPDDLTWNVVSSWLPAEGDRVACFGLLSDDVVAVDVEIRGERQAARIGSNSYLVVAAGTAEDVDAVFSKHADGRERRHGIRAE